MRILFLQSLTYPFIGLMSLSAVLKKRGHETRLQILNMARPSNRDLDRIKAFMPEVVGVPGTPSDTTSRGPPGGGSGFHLRR
jgi:hypothetical protein